MSGSKNAFADLLAVSVSSTEKPKPLPTGTYFGTVTGWEAVESAQKKTPGIKVSFKLTAPGDDVDQEALEEAGGEAAVQKRKLSTTFWMTEDSTYRLREFLEVACNMDLGTRSYGELLPESINSDVKLNVEHRMTERGDVLLEVKQVLPATE